MVGACICSMQYYAFTGKKREKSKTLLFCHAPFGELGVEIGGDFGDLLEDLESFVFEVDGAEADGLELAQDAGDFAGFAAEAPLAGDACADPVG